MNDNEKRSLIERYIANYNAFDVEGMMSVIHPHIEFENISEGKVNVTASGTDQFRLLVEHSKKLFKSHKQTLKNYRTADDQASVEVSYEGVLASELPNGMKAGETLQLRGRSEFTFRDGKIYRIADIS
jgi:ketosteroid isomerase-like protein